MANETRIVTGKVRLSYANIWKPRQNDNGGDPKYSVSILIPKSDTETLAKINRAIDAAIQKGADKFGGKIPKRSMLKTPLRDGDEERDDPVYAGCMFLNASSKDQPKIVDRKVQPILDQEEVYSGCYARVSINFFAYNTSGNRGIGAGLGNIQKLADGEHLSGGFVAPESEFEELDDDFVPDAAW